MLELKKELEEHASAVPGVKERTELVALVQVTLHPKRYRGTSLIRNCPPPRTALGP